MLIADELTPSLAAQVDWTKVRGFATDAGSRTYHTAILARSLDVPAVVGLHNASERVQPGQMVVIDGTASEADHRSDRRGAARAPRTAPTIIARPSTVEAERRRPATTADGVRIRLDANIEFPDDLAAARYAGAEGIGLYRSEFLLTSGVEDVRDEDRAVRDLPRHARGDGAGAGHRADLRRRRGSARVAAVGSTRSPAAGSPDEERGSRQGLRGLRLSLTRPELFRTQLRALLRAARHGIAAHHVPVRVGRRADARGAADGRAKRRPTWRGAAKRCRRCRSA